MIEVKLSDVFAIGRSLSQFSVLNLNIKAAYRISRILKVINDSIDEYTKTINKFRDSELLPKFGKKQKDGTYTVKKNDKGVEEFDIDDLEGFNKAYSEQNDLLKDEVIKIDFEPLTLDMLTNSKGEAVDITPALLTDLSAFIKE